MMNLGWDILQHPAYSLDSEISVHHNKLVMIYQSNYKPVKIYHNRLIIL